MGYTITFDKDSATVTVKNNDKATKIVFEGVNYAEQAMDFISRHCMVQMGQIGI